MDYLPRAVLSRAFIEAALTGILEFSRLLGRQDELVMIARPARSDGVAAR